jgi:exodeoxyribonuclease VIII
VKPGHYPFLSNAEYHGGPGISKSHLDIVAQGLPLYWQAYRNPMRPAREEKEAWKLGSITHCAILEPDALFKEFVIEPTEDDGAPRRPTSRQLNAKKPSADSLEAIAFWADFDKRAAGRTIVSQEHFDLAMHMRDAVDRHPAAGPLMRDRKAAGSKAEQSFYAIDPATGLLVKCRFDDLVDVSALDLKTTKDASEASFANSVCDYRYHVQEAWYRKVFKLVTGKSLDDWTFLAVDVRPPHQVGLYTLPRDVVAAAARVADENLRAIGDAIAADYWPDPGYGGKKELVIPGWGRKALGMGLAEDDYAGLD